MTDDFQLPIEAAQPADPAASPTVREDLAEPTLPDESLTIDAAEIRDLVARFRAVRNAKRGSFIADAADLPADPVRVATAQRGLTRAPGHERPDPREVCSRR